MTAVSIINRSASGSAIFPNDDSTCQRRARNPSTWSVIPATAKTMAAGHEYPSSLVVISTMNTGISSSRATVSAFGNWRRTTLEGYGDGDPRHPRLRERPLPCLPAGAAGPGGRCRLLGLAGRDGRPGGVAERGGRPQHVRGRLPGAPSL